MLVVQRDILETALRHKLDRFMGLTDKRDPSDVHSNAAKYVYMTLITGYITAVKTS